MRWKKFKEEEKKKTKQNEHQNVNRTVSEKKKTKKQQNKHLILKHFLMSGKWKVLRTYNASALTFTQLM